MADSTERVLLFYEGDTDRVILDHLLARSLAPDALHRIEDDKRGGGKERMVDRACETAVDAGLRAVLVRDRNGDDPSALLDWLDTNVRRCGASATTRPAKDDQVAAGFCGTMTVERSGSVGHLALVCAGDEAVVGCLDSFDPGTWTIDDGVLALACTESVYSSIGETRVDHATMLALADEVLKLFEARGLPVRSSKRLLHLVRAIADFRASDAAFAGRVLDVADPDLVKDHFGRLVRALHLAVGALIE